MTRNGVRIYTYDVLNRLVKINDAANPSHVLAAYVYDPFNRRVQKTVSNGGLTGDIPNGTTDYLYDGDQIIEERDNSAPTVWTKVNFWGQYVDELMFFATNIDDTVTTYRVLSDLLYRSVATVTTDNVIVEAYDTDAYGNTLCYSGPGTDGLWFTDDDVVTNNPINYTIFTGRQFDAESLIYFYRARYYHPTIGRFISRDPLDSAELSQGPNLYWYVKARSVNRYDPSGLVCVCGIETPPVYKNFNGQPITTSVGGERFSWFARFKNDANYKPECCEVHQFISSTLVPIHAKFPADMKPNVAVEDRDSSDQRYGYRNPPHKFAPNPPDPNYHEYVDDMDSNSDTPTGAPKGTVFTFYLEVWDVCLGGDTEANHKTIYTSPSLTVTFK